MKWLVRILSTQNKVRRKKGTTSNSGKKTRNSSTPFCILCPKSYLKDKYDLNNFERRGLSVITSLDYKTQKYGGGSGK